MSIIEKEEIAAVYRADGTIICAECMGEEDWNNLSEDCVITKDMIFHDREKLYFCDEHKGAIPY